MGKQFDMVFEGGGAKGMAFVGALKALEDHGHTPGRLIGTSAGAITATLLAVGYDATKMQHELGKKDERGNPVFASFMDAPAFTNFTEADIADSVTMKLLTQADLPGPFDAAERTIARKILRLLLEDVAAYRTIFSFVERGGLYVGEAFLNWLRERLNEQSAGFAALTLVQLHDRTHRNLSLVATDTTSHEMLVLNHRTAPNCPVAWAVRMSMSIPFAWHEVRWQSAWNPYNVPQKDGTVVSQSLAGHAIVDGGVLSNFPIHLLTSSDQTARAIMGDAVVERSNVLGLLIDEEKDVPGAPPPPAEDEDDDEGLKGDLKKLRTVNRVRRLLDTMMDAHDKQAIATNADLICRLPAKTYGTMEFDMSEGRKAALVKAGEEAMNRHLAGR